MFGRSSVGRQPSSRPSLPELAIRFPTSRTLEPGISGYSDLAVGKDHVIYCLYERGSASGTDYYATAALTLARFNLEWLTEGKER